MSAVEIAAALGDTTAPVIVTKGEKAADAVPVLFPGYLGTTSMGGASAAKHSDWAPLAGRTVVIWPDNDEPDRIYAHDVAALVTAAGAASVAIVAVPAEWPEGWDIADPLPDGAEPDALAGLLQSAIPWTPAPPNEPSGYVDSTAEIARLAALPMIEYGRQRKTAAQRLGCPVAILDKAVVAERSNGGAAAGQGRPLDLPEPEPWPEPVDGAALLEEMVAAIRQYVVFTEPQALATALWTIFTHAFDAFDFSPRLAITSAEMRSGKTRLVDALHRLVDKPLFVSGITAAALLRVIEQRAPCMLLDEIDTMMKGDAELREALRGLINSGFDRAGARFIKNVPTPGGGYEAQAFSTWCPMLLAGIGKLPDTVADRSIPIGLERKPLAQKVKRLRSGDGSELRDMGRKAARWVAEHRDALRDARPECPDQLHDRAADTWSPLFAIADVASGVWPDRARQAAVELMGDSDDQSSTRVALLADICAAFAAKRVDRLSSDELVAYLGSLDDRAWPEYRAGKPITKTQVARLLKPLHVSSGSIRLPDGSTPKGYYLTAFCDAFARYLPAENATTPQPLDFCAFASDFKTPHGEGCGVLEISGTERISAACGVVAVRSAPSYDDELEERAAILKFEAGFPRAEAERQTRAELTGRRDKSCLQ